MAILWCAVLYSLAILEIYLNVDSQAKVIYALSILR